MLGQRLYLASLHATPGFLSEVSEDLAIKIQEKAGTFDCTLCIGGMFMT